MKVFQRYSVKANGIPTIFGRHMLRVEAQHLFLRFLTWLWYRSSITHPKRSDTSGKIENAMADEKTPWPTVGDQTPISRKKTPFTTISEKTIANKCYPQRSPRLG